MNDTLDFFLDYLGFRVVEDTRESMGKEIYKRWKNPVHLKKMENASTQANLMGSCGDTLVVYLKIQGGRVKAVSFETSGCGSSQVSGEVACEYAEGKRVEDAGLLDGDDVLRILGGPTRRE